MSLRTRTTLLVAVVTAVLLVGGAVTLDVVLRHRLTESPTTWPGPGWPTCSPSPSRATCRAVLVNVTDDSVAQVVDDEGRVVAASAERRRRAAPHRRAGDRRAAASRRSSGPDDDETEEYRLWTSTGPAADGGRVRVYVGTSLESVREATANLRATLLVGVPLVWLLLVGGLVAARRPGAAPPRPDPRRGRHHHRGRPVPPGRRARTARRGRPAGRDDEPDARPAASRPASGSGGSSPTSPTTCAAR